MSYFIDPTRKNYFSAFFKPIPGEQWAALPAPEEPAFILSVPRTHQQVAWGGAGDGTSDLLMSGGTHSAPKPQPRLAAPLYKERRF